MRKSKKNDAGDKNCRLCAKYCRSNQVLDLNIEKVKCEEVIAILSSLNITYVDFSIKPIIGNVICSVCYKFLIKIQKFLHIVQKAQHQFKVMAPMETCSNFENVQNSSEHLELNCSLSHSNTATIIVKVERVPVYEATDQNEDSGNLIDHFQYKMESIDEYDDNVPLNELKLLGATSSYKVETKESKIIKTDTGTCNSNEAETCCEFKVCDSNHEIISSNLTADKNEILIKASPKKGKRKNTDGDKSNLPATTQDCCMCTLCEDVFESKEQLCEHMAKQHNIFKRKRRPNKAPITEEHLTCKMCVPNKVFNKTALLTTHHWKHHNPKGMMKHICHQCGKSYTKDALKYHLMKHDGIKPFVCQVCNMSFVDNIHLVMHAKVHTNIKPYKCSECDKAFRRKQLLRNHQLIHSGEKPFPCQHCDKRFRCISNLKTHENVHTGIYPFECKQCNKKFSCWGNCDKHMKKAHNTTLAKTKVTPQGKFPIDPITGEVIKPPDLDLEEWQRKLMTMSMKYKKTLKGC